MPFAHSRSQRTRSNGDDPMATLFHLLMGGIENRSQPCLKGQQGEMLTGKSEGKQSLTGVPVGTNLFLQIMRKIMSAAGKENHPGKNARGCLMQEEQVISADEDLCTHIAGENQFVPLKSLMKDQKQARATNNKILGEFKGGEKGIRNELYMANRRTDAASEKNIPGETDRTTKSAQPLEKLMQTVQEAVTAQGGDDKNPQFVLPENNRDLLNNENIARILKKNGFDDTATQKFYETMGPGKKFSDTPMKQSAVMNGETKTLMNHSEKDQGEVPELKYVGESKNENKATAQYRIDDNVVYRSGTINTREENNPQKESGLISERKPENGQLNVKGIHALHNKAPESLHEDTLSQVSRDAEKGFRQRRAKTDEILRVMDRGPFREKLIKGETDVLQAPGSDWIERKLRTYVRNNQITDSMIDGNQSTMNRAESQSMAVNRNAEVFIPRSQEVINQIINGIGKRITKGYGRVTIELSPPHLGSVNLDIIVRDNRVHVLIKTEHYDVRQLLQSNTEQLKTSLHNQGLITENVSISIQDKGDGHHLGFGQNGALFKEQQNHGGRGDDRHESGGETEHTTPLYSLKDSEDQADGAISLFA